eukprot:tig00000025_g7909.t2
MSSAYAPQPAVLSLEAVSIDPRSATPNSLGPGWQPAPASADDLLKARGDTPLNFVEPPPTLAEPAKEEKDAKKKPDPKKMVPFMQLLLRFATPMDKFIMLMGTIGAVINGAALPAFSIVFGEMMNSLNSSSIQEQVAKFSVIFVLIGVAVAVASWLETGLWMVNAERQSRRIRAALLRAMLRQEVAWFDSHKPGELSSRINADVKLIQDAIGEKVGVVIHHSSTFFAGIIVGLVKGWHLALVIMGAMPILGIAGAIMTKFITEASQSGQGAYAKAGDVADEVVTSVRTVVSFTGEEREEKRYAGNLEQARAHGVKKGVSAGLSVGFMMLTIFCSYGLAFWFGSWLILNKVTNSATGQPYTGGDIVTVFFAIIMGAFGIGQASPSFPAFADGRGAAFVIFGICDRASAIDSFDPRGETLPSLSGDIELRDVRFTYPTRADVPILRGASLSVRQGETVALVGHSGCGKSTCIQLILRYYDPAAGTVTVDGRDLKQLNVRWWRSQIGLVGQEPVLFATSIRENIKMGKQDATDEEIVAACKAANAHDFISKMPKGYDTYVGDIGAQLSGGQKQRIAIARALIKNPRILLLDEATSALDNVSERVVQEALDRLMKGRTTIVIAHRLSTIQKADRIYVFDAGVVAESGTHEALMARGGLYADLVHAQSGKHEEERDARAMGGEAPPDPDALAPARRSSVRHSTEQQQQHAHGLFHRHGHGQAGEGGAEAAGAAASSEEGSLKGKKGGKKKGRPADSDEGKVEVPWGRVLGMAGHHWYLIVLGILSALGNGAVFPVFSIIFSEILAVFYKPYLPNPPPQSETESEARFWALMFVVLGGAMFLFNFLQLTAFNVTGEHLTFHIRVQTFRAILRQNIGWFDDEKNSARIVTTNLQTDASLVQGATTARMGMMAQTASTLICGIVIAFVSGWKLALVVLSVAPLIALFGALQF